MKRERHKGSLFSGAETWRVETTQLATDASGLNENGLSYHTEVIDLCSFRKGNISFFLSNYCRCRIVLAQ